MQEDNMPEKWCFCQCRHMGSSNSAPMEMSNPCCFWVNPSPNKSCICRSVVAETRYVSVSFYPYRVSIQSEFVGSCKRNKGPQKTQITHRWMRNARSIGDLMGYQRVKQKKGKTWEYTSERKQSKAKLSCWRAASSQRRTCSLCFIPVPSGEKTAHVYALCM